MTTKISNTKYQNGKSLIIIENTILMRVIIFENVDKNIFLFITILNKHLRSITAGFVPTLKSIYFTTTIRDILPIYHSEYKFIYCTKRCVIDFSCRSGFEESGSVKCQYLFREYIKLIRKVYLSGKHLL